MSAGVEGEPVQLLGSELAELCRLVEPTDISFLDGPTRAVIELLHDPTSQELVQLGMFHRGLLVDPSFDPEDESAEPPEPTSVAMRNVPPGLRGVLLLLGDPDVKIAVLRSDEDGVQQFSIGCSPHLGVLHATEHDVHRLEPFATHDLFSRLGHQLGFPAVDRPAGDVVSLQHRGWTEIVASIEADDHTTAIDQLVTGGAEHGVAEGLVAAYAGREVALVISVRTRPTPSSSAPGCLLTWFGRAVGQGWLVLVDPTGPDASTDGSMGGTVDVIPCGSCDLSVAIGAALPRDADWAEVGFAPEYLPAELVG